MEFEARKLKLIWGGHIYRIVARNQPSDSWYAIGGPDFDTVEQARARIWQILAEREEREGN